MTTEIDIITIERAPAPHDTIVYEEGQQPPAKPVTDEDRPDPEGEPADRGR
ncbi:hypothetical protein [Arthrobacter sp. JCM 19049]|uniref:hypothetical protein n=1 Tax=Arthrobacter sp. JCM 19049 TaxID=1460643 RepID=UPI000A963EC7|nr:hypothetical protein [Arthrobacter sp. JCM 19049]